MHRLIWAELKKVFLNRTLVILLAVVILLSISLFTLIYYAMEQSYNSYAGYEQGEGGYTDARIGRPGSEVVPGMIAELNNHKSVMEGDIERVREILDADTVTLLRAAILKYRAINADVQSFANSNELGDWVDKVAPEQEKSGNNTGLSGGAQPIWDDVQPKWQDVLPDLELDDELIEEFFGSQQIIAVLETLNTAFEDSLSQPLVVQRLKSYVYYSLETLANTRDWYGWHITPGVKISYDVLMEAYQNYTDAKAEGASESVLQRHREEIGTELSYIVYAYTQYNSSFGASLFSEDMISYELALLEGAIGLKLTEADFSHMQSIIGVGTNSAKARIDEIIARLAEYSEITSLTKEDVAAMSLDANRGARIRDMMSYYTDTYLRNRSIENYTDQELRGYSVSDSQTKYALKKYITLTEYVLESGLYPSGISYGGMFSASRELSVEGFNQPSQPLSFLGALTGTMAMSFGGAEYTLYTYITFVFSFLSLVLITLCITLGGGSIAGEQQRGTIKMLIIRPYKRWKILTAKILSTLIVSVGLTIVCLLLLLVLGSLLFGYSLSAPPVISVFNGAHVLELSAFGELLINISMMIVSMVIYTLISTLFSAVFKSRTAAVLVSLLLNIFGGILSLALGWWEPFRYFIFNNTELFMYFGTGPNLLDMTFGFSFAVCVIYCAVFGFLTYYLFTKRDLN